MNRFYRIVGERGFQVYRHVGHSASNTHIGASRVVNTVMEAINVKAGDEIHALVGGTFLISGGETHPLSLKPPKHIFERDGRAPDRDIMELRVKRGLAEPIPEPLAKPDYSAARKRVEANRLREHHPEVVIVENSPEYQEMNGAIRAAIEPSGGTASGGWTIKARDIDAYGGPRFEALRYDVPIRIKAGAPGIYSVEIPKTLSVTGPADFLEMDKTKVFHFRGGADPLKAAVEFVAECGEALAPPGPRM